MRLVDTHIHLYSEEYRGKLGYIIREAVEEGVYGMVCVAEDLDTCRETLSIASKYEEVYPALGIHPWVAINSYRELEDIIHVIKENIDVINAIGEVGLDKKYGGGEKGWERQIKAFKKMVELALEHDKPLNIHSRRAARDVLEILRFYNVKKAHFHWFTDDEDTLREIVSMGYYVSFTPSITYSKRMQRMANLVPINQLLTETDGPVQFYGPLKGHLTRPKHIKLVLRKLSNIHNLKEEELGERIYRNFKRLYL